MKILKPGREQKGWTTEATCTGKGNKNGGCGAVLLVEQPDIYRTFRHCRDETDVFYTFTCAGCGVETDLNKSLPFTPPTKEEWLRGRKRADRGRDG